MMIYDREGGKLNVNLAYRILYLDRVKCGDLSKNIS